MILIEDVAVTRGATFGNAAIHVDRPAAESMVREMAAYHGALWQDPRLDHEWTDLLDAEAWQRNFNAKSRFDAGGVLGFRLAGDEIPPELRGRSAQLRPALMRSLALNVRAPQTLLHQDVHPGNWFRLSDGTLKLYDWQGVAKGNWALDFSYAISAGLDIADRRTWERELLALYLEELGAAGGEPPGFEAAWLAYRQQLFHGFMLWTLTFLVGKLSPVQHDEHVRMLIRRIGQAIVDLDALDSLDA
jgi:thiamine kinase-like enzyme